MPDALPCVVSKGYAKLPFTAQPLTTRTMSSVCHIRPQPSPWTLIGRKNDRHSGPTLTSNITQITACSTIPKWSNDCWVNCLTMIVRESGSPWRYQVASPVKFESWHRRWRAHHQSRQDRAPSSDDGSPNAERTETASWDVLVGTACSDNEHSGAS